MCNIGADATTAGIGMWPHGCPWFNNEATCHDDGYMMRGLDAGAWQQAKRNIRG